MSDDLLSQVDDTIHAKARLGIMAILAVEERADFARFKRALGLSDGNLGSHLRILEEAGYVSMEKGFVGRRPHTTWTITDLGGRMYRQYLEALERLLRGAAPG
ncbi:MAG TPA: transcriptional regulator [Spirochaetia bacterium]|nr:transcriptional regulator [Spirochaetia bacterium]